MKATLIVNPNAKSSKQIKPQEIVDLLNNNGFKATFKVTKNLESLNQVLKKLEGLVIIAGGDGTFREVAQRVINKKVSLAIIPTGTANNIAKSLNISSNVNENINNLKNSKKVLYDVGLIKFPWGEKYFFEGIGFGLFADILYQYNPNKGKSIKRSIESIKKVISEKKINIYKDQLYIDDTEIKNQFILVEILNTLTIGPRLKFADSTTPTDGLFNIVALKNSAKDHIIKNFSNFLLSNFTESSDVVIKKGSKIEFLWNGFPIHIDGEYITVKSIRKKLKDFYSSTNGVTKDTIGSFSINVKNIKNKLEIWI